MTGVVIAMNNESMTLIPEMDIISEKKAFGKKVLLGEYCGKQLALIICGVGKVNAAISTQYLIDEYHVEKIVNFGLAGGIGKNIEIGNVFAVSKCVQYDFDLSKINNVEIGNLEEFSDKYISLNSVKNSKFSEKALATGDRFNENPDDIKLLTEYMKADLRDMEGGAIAQVCALNNVPLYMFKAVSDKIESDSIKSYFEKSQYALQMLKQKMKDIFEVVNG